MAFRDRLLPVLLLLACSTAEAISPKDLPAGFTAQYELFKSGLSLAERQYDFTKTDHIAHFSSTTRLTGLAAIFNNDQVDETSTLDLSGQQVQVTEYQYSQIGKKQQLINSSFNFQQQLITTIINGQPAIKTHYTQLVWDKLSILLALISAANDSEKTLTFQSLDKGQIKQYKLNQAGRKEIELYDDEWIDTIIWTREHGNKKVIFYLDPSNSVPVKIEQYKQQKLQATLLLKALKWHQPNNKENSHD